MGTRIAVFPGDGAAVTAVEETVSAFRAIEEDSAIDHLRNRYPISGRQRFVPRGGRHT